MTGSETRLSEIRKWLFLSIVFSVAILIICVYFRGTFKEFNAWILATSFISAPVILFLWYIRIKHKEDDIEIALSKNQHDRDRLVHEISHLTDRHKLETDRIIAERFSRAVEHLGSGSIQTRLGAIYELEHISRDSEKEHWTVVEALAAFIRSKSLVQFEIAAQDVPNFEESDTSRHDIRMAMIVLGRREHTEYEDKKDLEIDLTNTNFRNLKLKGARLERALLWKSDFAGVRMRYAKLRKANLKYSILRNADMKGADLTDARVVGADLRTESLSQATLAGARYNTTTNEELKQVTIFPDGFDPKAPKFGMIETFE